MTDRPAVQPASDHLVALALAVRPDWNEHDLRCAIADARTVGMSWQQVLVGLTHMMIDPDASPRALVPAARRRTATQQVADYHHHAALAREAYPNLAARRQPPKDP